MPTTIKEAIAKFEQEKACVAAESEKVDLYGMYPSIEKMDGALATLKACKQLALSTNNIDKISNLAGLDSLKVLSLGRNMIKRIEGLDPVAETLEELWLSYNQIAQLTGLEKCSKLRVLYVSNNKIADYKSLEVLTPITSLEELQLIGNPVFEAAKGECVPTDKGSTYRIEVLRRVPKLKKLDGIPVEAEERDAAAT